jgi:hypothetical protein
MWHPPSPNPKRKPSTRLNSSTSFMLSQVTYTQYYLMHPDPYHLARTNLECLTLQDGLIGTTTHHNPYIQPPPMYGAPQYPQPYGGPSYYPPPPYQQPYPVSPPPPMSGPSSTPMMRPTSQPSSGSPSTSTYNLGTSESASPSYAPYGSLPQNNLYFPFPGPPQPFLLHMDNHMSVLTLFIPLPFNNFILLNS